ncbi:MAG: oligosaccharide flippase family protein [Treponema sp.]|nr:oligosaccharide flippase family protein [Treponema sp.]
MRLDKTKNTLRNTFWGFVQQIIQILLPFFTRTLLIKLLGAEYLGLNSLFSSILQVLNLAEAGFSTAIVFSMYKPIADDNHEEICALLSLYKKIYRVIGIVVTVIGISLIPFLPHLINGIPPKDVNIYAIYLLYLANSSLSYFLFAYKNSLFAAFQRNDITSKLSTILAILQPSIQILLLLFFKNLIVYTIVIPFISVIRNVGVFFLTKKYFPQYKCRGILSHNAKKGIYKRVSGLFIGKLSQTTRDSFDSIFISTFIGLNSVSIYSNYYYIMNAVHGFLQIIATSMSAGIGNSISLETPEENYSIFSTINFLYMVLAGWCTICLVCLYQPFMTLWLGKDFLLPMQTVVLLSIYFYLLCMGDIRGIFSGAAGLWWEERYKSILESIANIILNYLLVQLFDIFGIILATVITILFINFGYGSSILFRYYFKNRKKLFTYYLTQGYYIFATAICGVATFYSCDFIFSESSIINFLGRIFICLFVPGIIFLAFYHRKIKEERIRTIIKKIIRKGIL